MRVNNVHKRGNESRLDGREEGGKLSWNLMHECRGLKDDIQNPTQATEGKASRGGVLKLAEGC